MAATTTTTIRGVSIATPREGAADVFDLTLSVGGMEIRRPGEAAQHVPWNRISAWELEERTDDVLLTLRGDGAPTPLLIRGWTPEDLEVLLRDMTAGTSGPAPPVSPAVTPAPTPGAPGGPPPPADGDTTGPAPFVSRSERRRQRTHGVPWKAVVTVVLLGVLAAAVTVVLLQSAGVISWGFLGPTA